MTVALLALFVALGGASYAAVSLPKNTVGSKQLKAGAVGAADIHKNAITSKKVKDRSLLARDFKAGQLPSGSAGPKGDPGTNGTNGATSVVVRFAEETTPDNNNDSASVNCNPGERATGGAVRLISGSGANVTYFNPGGSPIPDAQGATPTGWTVSYFNNSGQTDTFRVYAICASP
jgi:hypothetical protein